MNYDELNVDERNTILRSTVLSIHFPTIMKLTSITLALVKMLRSSTLVDLILNFIRKNILNKKMNTDHTLVSKTLFKNKNNIFNTFNFKRKLYLYIFF